MSDLVRPPSASAPEHEDLVGRTVAGKYAVLRLIGRGGMGAVYEAEHVGIGKRVAIKFVGREFAKDEEVITRFAREARAASAIESAHIVSVFDGGVEDGLPYLVMELLRGEDLGTRLHHVGRLPLGEALHVTAQTLRGLARAHAAGIVHRDLKPDNVFLGQSDGDLSFVKIVDFGVSKIQRAQTGTTPLALTGKGTILGTPLYMSPEQAQAVEDLDGRADLYSVGAILFECLAGRPPHVGETYEQVILSICMSDAPPLRAIVPAVPEPVAAFVARALARDREKRFGSAAEMLAALHGVAPEERIRVPLELADTPARAHDAEAAPPADVSWSRGASPAHGTPSRRAPLSGFAMPLTAIGATLAGVALTLGLVGSMRAPAPAPARPLVVPLAGPSASAATPADPIPPPSPPPAAPEAARDPAPSRAPSIPEPKPASRPAARAPQVAPPLPSPAAQPPSKDLDIARELP